MKPVEIAAQGRNDNSRIELQWLGLRLGFECASLAQQEKFSLLLSSIPLPEVDELFLGHAKTNRGMGVSGIGIPAPRAFQERKCRTTRGIRRGRPGSPAYAGRIAGSRRRVQVDRNIRATLHSGTRSLDPKNP